MAWANIIVYVTPQDVDFLIGFINDSSDVMWITKVLEQDRSYRWHAVDRLDHLPEGEFAIWHKATGAINIPSGSVDVPDSTVADPYAGWTQSLDRAGETRPWFGSNPAPMFLRLRYVGRESSDSIGRSEFAWAGDHFRSIGRPAAPEAKRWWQGLRAFIRRHASMQAWPPGSNSKFKAYVFPGALARVSEGASLDVNP